MDQLLRDALVELVRELTMLIHDGRVALKEASNEWRSQQRA